MTGRNCFAFQCFFMILVHSGGAHGRSSEPDITKNGVSTFREAETVGKNVDALSGGETQVHTLWQEKRPRGVTVNITNETGGTLGLTISTEPGGLAHLQIMEPGDTLTFQFSDDGGLAWFTCFATWTDAQQNPFWMHFDLYRHAGRVIPELTCDDFCRWRIDEIGASVYPTIDPPLHGVQAHTWQS